MYPVPSFSSKISKHETDVSECIISLISSSLEYTESKLERKKLSLMDKISSCYLDVELKVTALKV